MRHKNPKYLQFVRTLPCSHCVNPETVAHHIIGIGMGAMGYKADDTATMPLCVKCHAEVHESPGDWPQIKWLLKTQNIAQAEGEL
jgi:hypothetical protein